jgi:sialic acid synthase SpsE
MQSRVIGAPWNHADPEHVFVIAEIGVNHNGERRLALELIDVAASAGADAVKFQTYDTDHLVTASARRAAYQVANLKEEGSQAEMLRRYELSAADYAAILEACRARGIRFLSTPFDHASVDFLATLGVEAYKVSSGDLTNLDLLAHIAGKARPVILSSGMAVLGEIEEALNVVQGRGDLPIALLHCVSDYPCAASDANLRAIDTLAAAFPDCAIGWSDHSEGLAVGFAAAAREPTRLIEKHFTLDRALPGPDHKASLEPDEFRAFVAGIRQIERALGSGRKWPTAKERDTAQVARRVLVAATDLPAGHLLRPEDIASLRAGEGLMPRLKPYLIGRRLRSDHPAGTSFDFAKLDGA